LFRKSRGALERLDFTCLIQLTLYGRAYPMNTHNGAEELHDLRPPPDPVIVLDEDHLILPRGVQFSIILQGG
tara:strand:+ start:1059 stop:1274 length:216 start_codon:yes stop_codon:yes gene_type:complete